MKEAEIFGDWPSQQRYKEAKERGAKQVRKSVFTQFLYSIHVQRQYEPIQMKWFKDGLSFRNRLKSEITRETANMAVGKYGNHIELFQAVPWSFSEVLMDREDVRTSQLIPSRME